MTDFMVNFQTYQNSDGHYDTILQTLRDKMPNLYTYASNIDSSDYTVVTATICNGDRTCEALLLPGNAYNKEGITVSLDTTMQTISNIIKDYASVSHDDASLISRYFSSEDFANINLDSEFVYAPTALGIVNSVNDDIVSDFNYAISLTLLLGSVAIIINFAIILYLVFGFFNRISRTMHFVTYSSKKFNKAIFVKE
jgi:hypothetical protein